MILRGRARGESISSALAIRYGARLTTRERVLFVLAGVGVIAVGLPYSLSVESAGVGLMGVYACVLGIAGRPPVGARQEHARDATETVE
jgi:hypothetical protein